MCSRHVQAEAEYSAAEVRDEYEKNSEVSGQCSVADLEFPPIEVYVKRARSTGISGPCSIVDLEFPPVANEPY